MGKETAVIQRGRVVGSCVMTANINPIDKNVETEGEGENDSDEHRKEGDNFSEIDK